MLRAITIATALAVAASADAVERRCELQGEPFTCVGLAERQTACQLVDLREEVVEIYGEMQKPGVIYDDIADRVAGNAIGIGFHDAKRELDRENMFIVRWMEDLISIFRDRGPATGMAAVRDLCIGSGG